MMLPRLRVSSDAYSLSIEVSDFATKTKTRSIADRHRFMDRNFSIRSSESPSKCWCSCSQSNQHKASNNPLSMITTSYSLDELDSISDNSAKAEHTVHMLNNGSYLLLTGQTLARSTSILTRKSFLRRNMASALIQLVFPAFGDPQNSITIGLRGIAVFFNLRTSAARSSSSWIIALVALVSLLIAMSRRKTFNHGLTPHLKLSDKATGEKSDKK